MNLKVDVINNGTVIDHIPGGRGLLCLKLLGVESLDNTFVLLSNVVSSKCAGGKKDIIKIEDKFLSPIDHNKLAIVAPNAMVNIVKDTQVIDKRTVSIPDRFFNLISCINPNCVSNVEDYILSDFAVEQKEPLQVRCAYCDWVAKTKYILGHIIE